MYEIKGALRLPNTNAYGQSQVGRTGLNARCTHKCISSFRVTS
jgi:hypothetical protein